MAEFPVDPNYVRDNVNVVLAEFLDEKCELLTRLDPHVEVVGQLLRDFVLGGGKRLRPLFAWNGFVAAVGAGESPEDPAAVMRAASALELIQACALVHDDIIDDSDTRRGNPTVHKSVQAYHERFGWSGDSRRFGESIAILAGDLALAWADDLVVSAGLTAEGLQRAWPAWAAMRTEVIAGQMLDITVEAAGDERESSARKINELKTAAYTIERPLHFGAMLGGADEELVSALRDYGRFTGVAFQLRDDMLGIFGDPKVTGKPAGDDIREGKRTLLIARTLQDLDVRDPEAAAALRSGLGTVTDPQQIAELTASIAGSQAVYSVEDEITTLRDAGLEALERVPLTSDVAETLELLSHLATDRMY